MIGFANPVAPPVVVEAVDGGLRRLRPGSTTSTKDRPPVSTAGVIAMVFDEMLGAANILSGNPGMTGHADHPLPQAHARCGPHFVSRPAA